MRNWHEISTTVSLLICCLQVDKHIRRLDTDLARFEADLKEKQIESTDYDSTSSKGKKSMCPLYLLGIFSCFVLRTIRAAKTKFCMLVLFQVTPDRRKRRQLKQGLKWRVQMKMAVPRVHRRKSNSFSRTLCIYFLSCAYLSNLNVIILSHFIIISSLSLAIHFLFHQRGIQQPCHQLWECAPIWCAGHAGGPKWTHLLSVPSGVLWRDDRLWQHWCEFWSMASFQCQSWVLWSDVWI